ncbi:MAG: FAD-dependent monooxygenase [Planctomycetota bacterium]
MKIAAIGGGPGALYFSILMKKAFPEVEIEIFERNRKHETSGWGVVFSDETLGNFEIEDPESYRSITEKFRYWSDIETYFGGSCVTSTGHGFCGMSRRQLLVLLEERALEVGVQIHYESEIKDPETLRDRDLVLGADGVNSIVREKYAKHFRPTLDWRKCKFCWLGTDKELEAFTFIFEQSEFGLFQVHAYPFEPGRGTWIVECQEDVWKKAGLDQASEEETVAFCEKLFAPYLDGHRLLSNHSIWRTFPTISNETWHYENVVLLGDSAHTAHFSIGSGTKLAMEDAIALTKAFKENGLSDLQQTLRAYEEDRFVDVIKIQKAAQTSLEWFENSARYQGQDPTLFSFNLMTRSKKITYGNLEQRDLKLVAETREAYRKAEGAALDSRGEAPAPVFVPFRVRELELVNRIVVSPMCQYSAENGVPNDWHLVHLGSRAIGGPGLIITEMTDVSADGRITPGCTGLWNEEQEQAWKRIVGFVHENGPTKIGIQLAHAGRKGSAHHEWDGPGRPLRADEGAWDLIAPSALPLDSGWPTPREMTEADMEGVCADFVAATQRAERAGFDLVELHMAHGYLLSSFLSPLCNQRQDQYGGSLDNRARFPLQVLRAMRTVWPERKAMFVRISASDWLKGRGTTIEESVQLSRWLAEAGCDVIDVSSAGNSPESNPIYGRMYQVPFAERIRYETGLKVMAVGAIQGYDHANTVLAAGRADLTAMARPHLANPYLTLHAATELENPDQYWPSPYLAARPKIE